MDRDQFRRFMRRFVLLWALSLISILGLLFYLFFTGNVTDETQNVGKPGASAYQLAKEAGFKGSLNEYLVDLHGEDAVSTHKTYETIIVREKPVYQKTTVEKTQVVNKPVPGKDGKDGKDGQDGRSIEMSFNKETGELLWRTEGTRGWNVLTTACELTGNCEAK